MMVSTVIILVMVALAIILFAILPVLLWITFYSLNVMFDLSITLSYLQYVWLSVLIFIWQLVLFGKPKNFTEKKGE